MQSIIDTHTHILWDVDDGPNTFEESVAMLRLAASSGTSHIIATPHFKQYTPYVSKEEIKARIAALNDYARKENLQIEVHSGNEIYADTLNLQAIYHGEALPLAESVYVLLEISDVLSPTAVEEITKDILSHGFIPIIAHVERSIWFPDKFAFLQRLCENQVRLQMDADSLSFRSGFRLARYARKLVRAGLIFVVASDCHNLRSRSPRLCGTFRILKRLVGVEKAQALLYDNPLQILKNEK